MGRFIRFRESYPYGLKDERLREKIVAAMRKGQSAEAGLLDTPGRSLHELMKLIRNVKKRLPEIGVPALVLQASEDECQQPAQCRLSRPSTGRPVSCISCTTAIT